MVQPSFSTAGEASSSSKAASPTAPLDRFLDAQYHSYYEELYRSSAVCLCILRLLPPVCGQIIMHNIWSYGAIKAVELKHFCRIDMSASLHLPEELLKPALNRKILHPIQHKKNRMEWPFNDAFKTGLRNALTGLGTTNGFGVPFKHEEDEEIPTREQLILYGEETWEAILKYMVSSGLSNGMATQKPRREVLELLHKSELMADPIGSNPRLTLDRLTITSKGFQFLLEERQTQLWEILIYYLENQTHQRSAIVLSVFFSLGCMQLGTAYSASQSFPDALSALEDLESYGFVYRPRDENGTPGDAFYPTHLATSLCSGDVGSLVSQTADEKRFLILETNYKIYAYTSNELEIAILNLFVDIKIRYKNLVVGKLDRQHVKAAMEKGISAQQIISYLASHAHPQMYNSPPPLLHPTIVDQLHLWDRERNRLKTEDAVGFQFYSKELFEDTLAEAQRYDGVLLSLPDQKYLVITPSIRESIRDFVKNMQNQLRGGF